MQCDIYRCAIKDWCLRDANFTTDQRPKVDKMDLSSRRERAKLALTDLNDETRKTQRVIPHDDASDVARDLMKAR